MIVDNVQKDDVYKTMGAEEHIQDNVLGTEKNNRTDANFGNSTFPYLPNSSFLSMMRILFMHTDS
jgi:hypothetical protein